MEETGKKFRETVLALGGGKAPLEVREVKFACFFFYLRNLLLYFLKIDPEQPLFF